MPEQDVQRQKSYKNVGRDISVSFGNTFFYNSNNKYYRPYFRLY